MILLLLPVAAQADLVLECSESEVQGTAPGPGAVDVPTDARITVVLSGCEAPETDRILRLEALDGTGGATLLLEAEIEWIDAGLGYSARSFSVDGGMAPLTDHRITVEGAAAPVEVAFRTGEGPSEPLAGAFDAVLRSASWRPRDDTALLTALLTPVPDPSGLSVVGLVDPEDESDISAARLLADRDGEPIDSRQGLDASWEEAQQPDEVCRRAVQWDGAGRIVGEGVQLCAEPEIVRGCSTAGASSASLLPLALLSLLFVRRSR
jgi:uncharacterized protein (TIGR03382 family)